MLDIHCQNEALFLDDDGNVVQTIYVDLRRIEDRTPITKLVKRCEKKYALERSKKIRIAKPEYFRKNEEGLIKDPEETQTVQSVIKEERINHPQDIKEAEEKRKEEERVLELVGENRTKIKVIGTRKTKKRTLSTAINDTGWIFCAAIAPETKKQNKKFRESLASKYNHVSTIRRPREFARTLGSMVCEQLGAQGNESEFTYTLNEEKSVKSGVKTQVIFHGPVVYVKDKYEQAESAESPLENMLLHIFVKSEKYRHQREYRFAVMSEKKGFEEVVYLNISPAMKGTLIREGGIPEHEIRNERNVGETEKSTEGRKGEGQRNNFKKESEEATTEVAAVESPHEFFGGHLLARTVLEQQGPDGKPLEIKIRYSNMEALRDAIRDLTGKDKVEAAGSAWHAVSCVNHLEEYFGSVVEGISISEDNYVSIEVKFADTIGTKATIVFGPLGTCRCKIENRAGRKIIGSEDSIFRNENIREALEEAGLRIRVAENSREK